VAVYYVRLRLPFGANIRDMTADERQTLGVDGVEIGEIIGGTPASEANLREGDFVLKFNHKPVHDKAAFQSLLQAHLGRRVILTIRRDGASFDRLVRLGTLPAAVKNSNGETR
jgi:S1-C subfamily serine protease